MKKVITAIGDKKLNNILKDIDEIDVKTSDILYQEGIIEALDKYPDIDIIILNEDIIGMMDVEELIRNIVLAKESIEIILITKENEIFKHVKQISKTVNKNENYVKQIVEELKNRGYIKTKYTTKLTEEVKQKGEYIENYTIKKEDDKLKHSKIYKEKKLIKGKGEIITIIGSSGIRKNNFYFNTS